MSKAILTFPIPSANSPTTTYEISVIRYTIGYQYQVTNSVVRTQRHGYPVRTKEQDINMTIQCRSVVEYDAIRKTMELTQNLSLGVVEHGFIRFSYPALNLDYLGFIPQIAAGTHRFDPAPQLSFTLSLFRDTINTITGLYSDSSGTWIDVVGPDPIELRDPNVVLRHWNPAYKTYDKTYRDPSIPIGGGSGSL
jgi:hypothetical protein